MTLRRPSILSRILWLHLLALVTTAILLSFAVNLLLSSSATNLQRRTLWTHATTIAQTLRLTPEGDWRLSLSPDLHTLYDKGYGGFAFAVVDDRGRLVTSVPANLAPVFLAMPRQAGAAYLEQKRGGETFYGASFPERRGDHVAWIMVAQNLEHPDIIIDDIVTGFLGRVVMLTAPLILLLFSIDLLIVRRALKPVVIASKAAQLIQPGRIDQRLPTANLPREILPMAQAMNEALARLEAGYAAQRAFTADAAHELRTPLTVLRMRIDSLPDKAAAAALRPDIDVMSRIVGQLLEMAELDAATQAADARADLHAIAMEVAVALMPMALAQDKVIAIEGVAGPVWVAGNGALLYRAIRNLVENALHHTPPKTHVEIRIGQAGCVDVIDNGPGIPAEERAHIFQRFWRGRRNRNGGAGLGLAIVRRIAQAQGGTITLNAAAIGGAHFTLQIPLYHSGNKGA